MNFESEFVRKGLAINLIGEAIPIFADQDKISQVMINLLSNALKFTPSGGVVEVEVSQRISEVEITVKDNGLGISPEDQPFMFERFYRVDKSRSRLTGGSGIGLAIVKSLVEAHQGTVTVKSKVGIGTEFIIILPLTKG